MANAIDNPYGYLVTPEDGLGLRHIQALADLYSQQLDADFLRRLDAAGRGAPNVISPAPFPSVGSTGIFRNTVPVAPVQVPSYPAPTLQAAPRVVAPAPIQSTTLPPTPSVPVDSIEPGIPIAPSPRIRGRDIGVLPAPIESPMGGGGGGGMRGFNAGAPTWTPVAAPTPSHMFDRPQFIYTNPVAAQQAASVYNARLAAETAADSSYRDYAARLNAERNANERAQIQAASNHDALTAQQAESAANRAASERIATSSELIRQHRQAEVEWANNEQRWKIGVQTASMLNSNPNAKVDRSSVYQDPVTGLWQPRWTHREPPVAPWLPTAPSATPQAPAPPAPVATAPDGMTFLSTDIPPRRR